MHLPPHIQNNLSWKLNWMKNINLNMIFSLFLRYVESIFRLRMIRIRFFLRNSWLKLDLGIDLSEAVQWIRWESTFQTCIDKRLNKEVYGDKSENSILALHEIIGNKFRPWMVLMVPIILKEKTCFTKNMKTSLERIRNVCFLLVFFFIWLKNRAFIKSDSDEPRRLIWSSRISFKWRTYCLPLLSLWFAHVIRSND